MADSPEIKFENKNLEEIKSEDGDSEEAEKNMEEKEGKDPLALKTEEPEEVSVECDVIQLSDDECIVKPRKKNRQTRVICEICSKVFGDKHILKKHMLIHTDMRPHICAACGKAFRHKHTLKGHEVTHLGSRHFACATCGRSFKFLQTLKDHEESHRDPEAGRIFSCPECDASFKRLSTLRTHARIHSGEKPYACTQCSKAFVQKANLVQHLKMHNNERDFACDQCDKKFMTNSKLKRHYQKHLKKELQIPFNRRKMVNGRRKRKSEQPQKVTASSDEDLEKDQELADYDDCFTVDGAESRSVN